MLLSMDEEIMAGEALYRIISCLAMIWKTTKPLDEKLDSVSS